MSLAKYAQRMYIDGCPLNGVGKPSKHPACFVLGFARSTQYVDLAWEVG